MKTTFLTLIFILALLSSVKAQHDHSSHNNGSADHKHKTEAPHGGEIKDAGKYHIEIMFDVYTKNEKLNIWIYKSNYKILEQKDYSGKVKLKYADGKEIEKELISGADKLFCNVDDITKAFSAVIVLNIKGKEYHTIYNYKGFSK